MTLKIHHESRIFAKLKVKKENSHGDLYCNQQIKSSGFDKVIMLPLEKERIKKIELDSETAKQSKESYNLML